MGRVCIYQDDIAMEVPLASSTLLGRHPSCTYAIPDPRIPLYWVELRWAAELEVWIWRALAGDDALRTRGFGSVPGRPGWYKLLESRTIPHAAASIRMLDTAPPAPFAQDLVEGEVLEDERFQACFEVVGAVARTPAGETCIDGELVVVEGRVLRVHLPAPVVRTERPRLRLDAADCELWVDGDPQEGFTATFIQGAEELPVQGESARLLFVYAREFGGGLTTREALLSWRTPEVGGNPRSGADRLRTERQKLRQRLAAQGAGGVDALFTEEMTRNGNERRHGLSLEADNIHVPGWCDQALRDHG
ncbi:MAG: hypothetical protein H6739_18015 [Alphaproteobacteria bacterium]|nr:hypothetical protein [Alphaproteobacteria bacterium]